MASEMADLERGERIRELREARHLTQPAVWERMCAVGGPKPNGKPFISFRMYQRYEEGRGISWGKLRVLAEVLDTREDYILRGDGERRQPRPARSIDTDLAERLASIEERLDASDPVAVDRLDGDLEERISSIEDTLSGITTLLREARSEQDRISELLARQSDVLEQIEAATRDAGDAADRLDEAVEQAASSLRSSAPARPAAPPKTSPKRTPRAAR
jgi:transcriptional regulator with XRE-family HTH domain